MLAGVYLGVHEMFLFSANFTRPHFGKVPFGISLNMNTVSLRGAGASQWVVIRYEEYLSIHSSHLKIQKKSSHKEANFMQHAGAGDTCRADSSEAGPSGFMGILLISP